MLGRKRSREQSASEHDDSSSDQDLPSQIIARRRKTRRRAVTTLPDHARQQLSEAFGNVDIQGEGRVNRFKLLEIVKEVYRPTATEVTNVLRYFDGVEGCSELKDGGTVSFEGFVAMFKCVVLPVLTGLELGWKGLTGLDLGWNAARDLFHTNITQTARHGASTPPSTSLTCTGEDVTSEIFREELWRYYEGVEAKRRSTHGTSFITEMVRQAFIISPNKLSQLAGFFNTSKDDKVTLGQFIHGMTLLYGDMKLLLTNVEPHSPTRSPPSDCSPPRNRTEFRLGEMSPDPRRLGEMSPDPRRLGELSPDPRRLGEMTPDPRRLGEMSPDPRRLGEMSPDPRRLGEMTPDPRETRTPDPFNSPESPRANLTAPQSEFDERMFSYENLTRRRRRSCT